jgi:hypothetical protein
MDQLTKDERSLLLFLETCAVDHGGIVDTCHMNATDQAIAARWVIEGFIEYARIRFHDIEAIQRKIGKGYARPTHWVVLGEAERAERKRAGAQPQILTWWWKDGFLGGYGR